MSIGRRTAVVAVLGLLMFGHMYGQGPTATISGTVTDTTGAAVPGAKIDIKNVGTGLTQHVTTDAQGRFTVPNLAISDYEVDATQAGFQTVVRKGITLSVGADVVVDFSLQVGQQQQTITVEGQVSQVETTSAAVASLIEPTQMRELPLNGRNFEQLLTLAPGVQQVAAGSTFYGGGQNYSVAGSRPEGQAFLIDNTDIANFWNHSAGAAALGSSLGIEAIAEFQVLTNTFSAQFGGNGPSSMLLRNQAQMPCTAPLMSSSATALWKRVTFSTVRTFLRSAETNSEGAWGGQSKRTRCSFL